MFEMAQPRLKWRSHSCPIDIIRKIIFNNIVVTYVLLFSIYDNNPYSTLVE